SGPGNEQAKEKTPAQSEPVAKAASSLKTSAAEASQALLNLTGRVADETQKQAKLLWSVAPGDLPAMPTPLLPGMGDPGNGPDPAQETLQNVTANVTTGLQSVTNTAQQAVNYFTREIPTSGKKAKGS